MILFDYSEFYGDLVLVSTLLVTSVGDFVAGRATFTCNQNETHIHHLLLPPSPPPLTPLESTGFESLGR